MWNSLPQSLKTIQSTSLFKHSVSVFLLTGVGSAITELCTFMAYAPCTLHCIAYYCYYHFHNGWLAKMGLLATFHFVLLLSLFSAIYLLYCGE